MAQTEVKVPDIGDFKDVAVIEVLVQPGDTVKVEQSLVTVESDKASMEIPSSQAGVVKEMRGEGGEGGGGGGGGGGGAGVLLLGNPPAPFSPPPPGGGGGGGPPPASASPAASAP